MKDGIRFDGKVAVVVGAGPGLDTALVRRFALAGAEVAAVARSAASLEAAGTAAREAGISATTVAADITSRTDARRMANEIHARYQRIDVLVNVAFGNAPRRDSECHLDVEPDRLR